MPTPPNTPYADQSTAAGSGARSMIASWVATNSAIPSPQNAYSDTPRRSSPRAAAPKPTQPAIIAKPSTDTSAAASRGAKPLTSRRYAPTHSDCIA